MTFRIPGLLSWGMYLQFRNERVARPSTHFLFLVIICFCLPHPRITPILLLSQMLLQHKLYCWHLSELGSHRLKSSNSEPPILLSTKATLSLPLCSDVSWMTNGRKESWTRASFSSPVQWTLRPPLLRRSSRFREHQEEEEHLERRKEQRALCLYSFLKTKYAHFEIGNKMYSLLSLETGFF